MSYEKEICEQLDEFNKLILNLENIYLQIDDKDQVFMFIS